MSNPTDRRVARTVGAIVLVELEDTQLCDATEQELVYKIGMATFALKKLLEVVDEPKGGAQ